MAELKLLPDGELFRMYRENTDMEARDELFSRYLYIVRIVAKKFSGRGIDFDDLYQTASLALIHAIDRFDSERGVQFNTFATPSIIGEVKNYFRDTSRSIRIPRADAMLVKHMDEAIAEYMSAHGETPNVQWLAEKLGIAQEKVLELIEMKRASSVVSLDTPVDDESETGIADLIGEEESGFGRIENRDFFNYCISQLADDEKILVSDRFVHGRTQSEVAAKLGVSQMQVSRMERKILDKLKTTLV